MADKLVKKLIDNYNDVNLQSLKEHIEKESKEPAKPVYVMVQKHTGPTKVTVTEKSMKNLTKTLLK
ncbi:MAG: hypothetical protein IKA36_03720 [Clostridia bacterium]|nr:hypothetical protein [Clostridia bacterium]